MKIKFYNLFLQESIHEVEKIYNSKAFMKALRENEFISSTFEELDLEKQLQKDLILQMKMFPDNKEELEQKYKNSVQKVKLVILPIIKGEKKIVYDKIKNIIKDIDDKYKEISERWMLHQYINGDALVVEISANELQNFHILKSKFNENDSRDIFSYKRFELENIISKYSSINIIPEILNNKDLDKYIIFKDDRYVAYKNNSLDINKILCKDANWCTTKKDSNFTERYNSDLILIIDKEKFRRYLLYLNNFEIKDETNNEIVNVSDLRDLMYNVVIKLADNFFEINDNEIKIRSLEENSSIKYIFDSEDKNKLTVKKMSIYDEEKGYGESVIETFIGNNICSINDKPASIIETIEYHPRYKRDVYRNVETYYNKNSQVHRENNPAKIVKIYSLNDRSILSYSHRYYKDDIVHKDDNYNQNSKPCALYIEKKDDYYTYEEEWWFNGKKTFNRKSEKKEFKI